METFEQSGAKLYKFTRGPSTFIANIENGARLMNWAVSFADGAVRDVIYWPENGPVGGGEDFGEVRGGIPVLFPFAGASFADGEKAFGKLRITNCCQCECTVMQKAGSLRWKWLPI